MFKCKIFPHYRSNDIQSCGFSKDPRRINVSLTRAKCSLIILGNSATLSSSSIWEDLFNNMRKDNQMFDDSALGFHAGSLVKIPECTPVDESQLRGTFTLNKTVNQRIGVLIGGKEERGNFKIKKPFQNTVLCVGN